MTKDERTADRELRKILNSVRRNGGVVRSTTLIDLGYSKRMIASLTTSGELVRLRRAWVAVPDADPVKMRAALDGVVLTCVTQAMRLGLWVLSSDSHVHVAAAGHAGRILVSPHTTVHWALPPIPRHPNSLEDAVENVLAIVAACQPFERALAVWESALRKGLVDPCTLERLPLSGRARDILRAASPYSDSGPETFVVPRLKWMGLRIVPQVWLAGHRVDFLIGERLVLQIDGGHHVDAQRAADIAHDAQLMLMGYHVIRVGYDQVVNDWAAVQDLIMRAVAQGLHLAAR
jgi:very-short-patch-repair endonuclease